MNEFFHLHLAACASTNDEAWKIPRERWPAVVSTDLQTRGRGQQGRVWTQAPGKQILASLVYVPKLRSNELLTWIQLAAGVAAIEALEGALGKIQGLRLKWPNDIYIGDAKLSGILCESRFQGNELLGVVVGIGMNVSAAPSLAGQTTIALSDLFSTIDTTTFQGDFLARWADGLLSGIDPSKIKARMTMAPKEFFQSLCE